MGTHFWYHPLCSFMLNKIYIFLYSSVVGFIKEGLSRVPVFTEQQRMQAVHDSSLHDG